MSDALSLLLWESARRRPDAAAVQSGANSLTYGELACRAGQLGATLRDRGSKPGDRVGVWMPKSLDAVASLHGVLWSGAGYVPLDAGAPLGRIAYMVADCAMRELIADEKLAASWLAERPAAPRLERMLVVGQSVELPRPPAGVTIERLAWSPSAPALAEPIAVDADSLAYILYTSGSTGQPKGVMISHANALAFVRWSRDAIGVTEDDRLSSHAPFHFDLSIFDLYASCLAGAAVVLVPDGLAAFPVRLAEWIERERINVWYSVPSALAQLAERGRWERFTYPRLRAVIFAGEVFAPKYLRAWLEKLPSVAFHNWYGPTETNVCTGYDVPKNWDSDRPASIGGSASEAKLVLVDETGAIVSEPGAVGELWVAGPTVALGYWGDESRTRERFVDGPSFGAGERFYRTGDLASWDGAGQLTFHGRRDHMVKSRGYRIELGEIESAGSAHPAIAEICVVAIPDPELGARLRACVAAKAGQAIDADGLHRHLADRLPRYMIPQEVFFFDRLPKTTTGKADRQSLAGDPSGWR